MNEEPLPTPANFHEAPEVVLGQRMRVHAPTIPTRWTPATSSPSGAAGDPACAIEDFEAVLADRARVLGPDDPSTLLTRRELADSRGEAGGTRSARRHHRMERPADDPVGAVEVLDARLADCLRVFGPNHPHTLRTRHSLTYWRGAAGDPDGCVAALQKLQVDCERILGPDHPYTLTVRCDLLQLRDWTHNPTDAVTVIQTLLADRL